mmetsp:Transcript_67208/g.146214  ORF Transcript_67208/g.146214 Transcript_67208/m.146214 type:complete len:112 (-) Transcript_67208:1777-2112(-)
MCGEVAQMKSSTATTSSSNNNSTDLVNGQTAPNVTTNMTTTTTTPMARTGSATHNVTFKSQSTSSNDSDSDSDGMASRDGWRSFIYMSSVRGRATGTRRWWSIRTCRTGSS